MASVAQKVGKTGLSLHGLGVICGLTAGVWLGAAEAPTKLVNSGFSPFAISLVHGGWSVYCSLDVSYAAEGNRYVFADLMREEASDRVGASGWSFVGRGEYADGLCDSRRGPGGGISDVERECADRTVLGAGAVSRTGRCEREEHRQSCGGRDRDCDCGGDAGLQHDPWRVDGRSTQFAELPRRWARA